MGESHQTTEDHFRNSSNLYLDTCSCCIPIFADYRSYDDFSHLRVCLCKDFSKARYTISRGGYHAGNADVTVDEHVTECGKNLIKVRIEWKRRSQEVRVFLTRKELLLAGRKEGHVGR